MSRKLNCSRVFKFEQLENRIALAIANPGFEQGVSDWSADAPGDSSVTAVSSHSAVGGDTSGKAFKARSGSQFALLAPGTPEVLTKLSQTFDAEAGSKIYGWAFFDAGDYLPYNDFAQVIIRSPGGGSTTVFSSNVAAVGDYGETAWTPWEYTFSNAGSYTIEASIANRLDSALDSYLGLDIAVGTDIAVELKPVVPKQAPDLQLGHFLSKETLNFPITISNAGGEDLKGKVDVKIFLSTTTDLTGKIGTIPVVEKKDVEIDLSTSEEHPLLTLDGEVPSGLISLLAKNTDYYFVVEVSSTAIQEDASALENNVFAFESSYKFAGTLSSSVAVNPFFARYYDILRKTLKQHSPFSSQGAPTPTNGKEFTAAFETSGGYSSPDLTPYLDSKGIATIGIGINLKAVQKPNVTTALVTAVKAYYSAQAASQFPGYTDISAKTEKQVIAMLISQAETNTAQPAFTVADAQLVYDLRYAISETSAQNAFGANWAAIPAEAKWVLVDLDFNLGSLSAFPTMKKNIIDGEYLLAAYEFLNAKRTLDVGPDRTIAGLQALLGDDYTKLGKIL